MTLALLWVQLGVSAAIILGAATFLARSADVIAYKTGLGRSFVGVVLLATATSLPELGTGVSSVTLEGEPDLAAGDAFGSNLFNLLIIGLLDIFWRQGPILQSAGRTSILVAVLGIMVISVAAAALLIHGATTSLSGWYVSPVSVVLVGVFLWAMYMVYRSSQDEERSNAAEKAVANTGNGDKDEDHEYAGENTSRVVVTFAVSAATIIATAVWLAHVGDGVAEEMGWEASYVGTQFLALSTSLPELAASFAAIRLGAAELAVSNVLGSNIFNMGFVLFLDDVAYVDGTLWAAVSDIHSLTAAVAVAMTCVVLVGLISRSRKRPGKFWTFESSALIGLYAVASLLVFALG